MDFFGANPYPEHIESHIRAPFACEFLFRVEFLIWIWHIQSHIKANQRRSPCTAFTRFCIFLWNSRYGCDRISKHIQQGNTNLGILSTARIFFRWALICDHIHIEIPIENLETLLEMLSGFLLRTTLICDQIHIRNCPRNDNFQENEPLICDSICSWIWICHIQVHIPYPDMESHIRIRDPISGYGIWSQIKALQRRNPFAGITRIPISLEFCMWMWSHIKAYPGRSTPKHRISDFFHSTYYLQMSFDLRSYPYPDSYWKPGNASGNDIRILSQNQFDMRSDLNKDPSPKQRFQANVPLTWESICSWIWICSQKWIWIWNPISGYGIPYPDMESRIRIWDPISGYGISYPDME